MPIPRGRNQPETLPTMQSTNKFVNGRLRTIAEQLVQIREREDVRGSASAQGKIGFGSTERAFCLGKEWRQGFKLDVCHPSTFFTYLLLEILTDGGEVVEDLDAQGFENAWITDSGKLENLRGLR